MRLHVLSDLHLEFSPFTPSIPADADLVVIAGDTLPKGRAASWVSANIDRRTILIGGNHDCYRTSVQRAQRVMSRDAAAHVQVLENQTHVHQGVRFLGCTGWTDFKATGSQRQAMDRAASEMNDYRMIRMEPGYRKLRPADTQALAEMSKAWLLDQVSGSFDGKTVIVTHTCPLVELLPEDRNRDHLDAAYTNDWLEFLTCKIDLWIFGHTHFAVDRTINGVRFISNPKGYPGEETGFQPDLIVSL